MHSFTLKPYYGGFKYIQVCQNSTLNPHVLVSCLLQWQFMAKSFHPAPMHFPMSHVILKQIQGPIELYLETFSHLVLVLF
jgi:hypothetical protein